jgi:hypothetical protein
MVKKCCAALVVDNRRLSFDCMEFSTFSDPFRNKAAILNLKKIIEALP